MKFSLKNFLIVFAAGLVITSVSFWNDHRIDRDYQININISETPPIIDCASGGYEIKNINSEQACVFNDNSYCELWQWYNGECQIGDKK